MEEPGKRFGCDAWYRLAFDPAGVESARIEAVDNLARECRTHNVFQALGYTIPNERESVAVRRAMVHALGSWDDSLFAIAAIVRGLSVPGVRSAAIETLDAVSPLRGEREVRLLRELKEPREGVQKLRMAAAMGKIYGRDPRVLELLGELLRTGDRWERAIAASELWGLGEVSAALAAVHDPDLRVRSSLAAAIRRYPEEGGAAALHQLEDEAGAAFNWRRLLDDLSELHQSDPGLRRSGAKEAEIQETERRLGIRLPPSYRAFLPVSNGFAHPSSFIPELYGAGEIERFAKGNAQWAEAYQEVYPQLGECLQISAAGDAAVVLLNPHKVDAEGEWQTYFFANWVPGAREFASFRAWLQDEVDSLCEWRNY